MKRPTGILKTTITAPPTLHVVFHSAADIAAVVAKARRIARRTEGRIRFWDGTEEWYEVVERVDICKSGSAQYRWDKSGNKVLCDVTRWRIEGGNVTCEAAGTTYRVL